MHTNTQQKAPRAANSEGLHTDTNASHFASHGPIQQAHGGKVIAPDDFALTTTATEARVDTRLLAKHLGNRHQSLFELVKNHRADFEQLGILRFQTGVIDGRGQPEKFAMLNEDQATLALAYSKNTKRVRDLKVKLVKAFGIARRAAAMRQTEYLPEYHLLHDRIAELAADSSHARHVHQNFNKLLNKFAGIAPGQRASAALPQTALLIVGQLVAAKAAQDATDHHVAYQCTKSSLAAVQGAIALEGLGHE